jgi:hypothetical protein
MRSKSEIFALSADKCSRKAAAATDRMLKWLFSDLAVQWLGLAAIAGLLEADKKEREWKVPISSEQFSRRLIAL